MLLTSSSSIPLLSIVFASARPHISPLPVARNRFASDPRHPVLPPPLSDIAAVDHVANSRAPCSRSLSLVFAQLGLDPNTTSLLATGVYGKWLALGRHHRGALSEPFRSQASSTRSSRSLPSSSSTASVVASFCCLELLDAASRLWWSARSSRPSVTIGQLTRQQAERRSVSRKSSAVGSAITNLIHRSLRLHLRRLLLLQLGSYRLGPPIRDLFARYSFNRCFDHDVDDMAQ